MKGKTIFTKAEAEEVKRLINAKLRADSTEQKRIRNKIRKLGFYASDFGFRDSYTVDRFLSVVKIIGSPESPVEFVPKANKVLPTKSTIPNAKSRSLSDESYIIDLCDEALNQKAIRQHRFDFLLGDSGTRLPVDAYYPSLNLVIEFNEKQHTESVSFFDNHPTVSGVNRGEQRRIYYQRKCDLLPRHGIKLIEFDYSEFEQTRAKKLVRYKSEDLKVITRKLKEPL